MQKFSLAKLFLLLTLFFIMIAVVSFKTFTPVESRCTPEQCCLKTTTPAPNNEMIWERISRTMLTVVAV